MILLMRLSADQNPWVRALTREYGPPFDVLEQVPWYSSDEQLATLSQLRRTCGIYLWKTDWQQSPGHQQWLSDVWQCSAGSLEEVQDK